MTREPSTTAGNEAQVRAVIERWVKAIRDGDRAGILANHSEDLLMFDLPIHKARGLQEYSRTWDYFYESPRGAIQFELSELEITAGSDVAFASCLVHCDGTSAGPVDLRLTIGLAKIAGQWTITHEHHSMPVDA